MEYLDLIQNQSLEILNIYNTISDIININEETKEIQNNKIYALTINNNSNVEKINKRLNDMDLDIIDNDKIQSKKKEELTEKIRLELKENNKKNGIYKTELTKRLTKIDKENDNKITLLTVDINKNNKNKELELKIIELNDTIKSNQESFIEYQKKVEDKFDSLQREFRVRITQLASIKSIRGIVIK
tara:strand:- start:282 stop:842 length:561 start_codon:yes stop_codon:yes gene_type:complete